MTRALWLEVCVEIACVRASFHTCSLFQCPTPTEEERHCWRVLALHCRGVVSTRERTWRHLSPPWPHLRDVGILTGQWRSQERKRSKNHKTVQIFYAVFGLSLASIFLMTSPNNYKVWMHSHTSKNFMKSSTTIELFPWVSFKCP